jgi:hypothetical protein
MPHARNSRVNVDLRPTTRTGELVALFLRLVG